MDNRPHVFLDLDLTLIHAVELEKFKKKIIGNKADVYKQKIAAFDPNFKLENFNEGKLDAIYDKTISAREKKVFIMDNDYIIFVRPGLQDFLDFLFRNFQVSVWTAASRDYAIFIIQFILLLMDEDEKYIETSNQRKLNYIFFYYHCSISQDKDGGYKNLKFICSQDETCSIDKMFILDDNIDVYKTQPKNTIIALPFNEPYKTEIDTFLSSKARPALEEKLKSLNFSVN